MTETEEQELLAVAQEAAHAAGAELRARFGQRQRGVRSKTSPTDLVSDADLAAESAIRSVLDERRPDDGILAEEGGASGGGSDASGLRWIVDPLDGTINFLFGIPVFAVSVACEDGSGTVSGVVLDPIRDECFAATRSGQATVNAEPIAASDCSDLGRAMLATGFAYDAAVRADQGAVVARVLPRVRDIRRAGAAAIDLAWCACGRYDAYYERGVHAWDIAAGSLLATRAGLEVRTLAATQALPWGIACAPAPLIDDLVGLVGSDA
jgi:myo-inositol-1(or 4)-monophosphatase